MWLKTLSFRALFDHSPPIIRLKACNVRSLPCEATACHLLALSFPRRDHMRLDNVFIYIGRLRHAAQQLQKNLVLQVQMLTMM